MSTYHDVLCFLHEFYELPRFLLQKGTVVLITTVTEQMLLDLLMLAM